MEKYNNKVNDKFNGLKSKLDAATEQRVHEYEDRSVKPYTLKCRKIKKVNMHIIILISGYENTYLM